MPELELLNPGPDALQWGRDLSVAECMTVGHLQIVARNASMGPRPFGRGMDALDLGLATIPGFNGAATFRSRNAAAAPERRPGPVASMGPRPFGRGMKNQLIGSITKPMLQWGRDLSVAECRK